MANVSKINGYDIADSQARQEIASIITLLEKIHEHSNFPILESITADKINSWNRVANIDHNNYVTKAEFEILTEQYAILLERIIALEETLSNWEPPKEDDDNEEVVYAKIGKAKIGNAKIQ